MISEKKLKDLRTAVPTNQESPFKIHELFFSVTDPKSNMTFINEIFERVSKFDHEEIIGQPHKLIRHPDMPRAVFKIFWDRLKADKPVAAYVKNMAKDGTYYWVKALAFPCDGGYLSIRLKPTSDLFDKIKDIYSETLQVEQAKEEEIGKRKAMEQSEEYLLELLKNEGFSDYEEFMWNALQQEMHQREEALAKTTDTTRSHTEEVPEALLELEPVLQELVISLNSLQDMHQDLVQYSDYILELARSILLLSINAQIGSSKLDQDDIALSVIAEQMGEQSIEGEEKLLEMKDNIQGVSDLVGMLNFEIVASKLQVEMTIDFMDEIAADAYVGKKSTITADKSIELLYDAFLPRLSTIKNGLGELPNYLKKLLTNVEEIEKFLLILRLIHNTGKVEIARLNDDSNSFHTTIQDLLEEVTTAQEHLDKLTTLVHKNKKMGEQYTDRQQDLNALISELQEHAHASSDASEGDE
ncbi:PAS domain-containing protein [Fodinibius halophilus]|uniref:PAS domain-containing protein n=1 Tax=Fodinibius halophilus TaxID=1736908 RepID=A0A6M1T9H5_9BACT|nr:PAS domain-containing protein [Fodinibius halophilus]NGP89193.1 PAS domain-containing protein [Fodinibius halophilus]